MPKTCWTLAAAGLLLRACGSEASAAANPGYTVDAWTVDEGGLPQNSVISMTQTRDGYLWLGTGGGLARFDGLRFKTYDEKDVPGLNGKIVKLFEDSRGNLWVGTESAGILLAGKDGKVTRLLLGKEGAARRLVTACEDSSGGVLLSMATGELYRYWEGSARLIADKCHDLVADDTGVIWVGTTNGKLFGLGPFPKATTTAIPVPYEVTVGRLDYLLASRRGGYWRLANGRIQKCRADSVQRDLGRYPWSEEAPVLAACEDQEGHLVVGTYGDGVWWLDAEGKARHLQDLSHSSIWCLTVDREGSLWVGTDGGGLNRVKRKSFEVLEATVGSTVQSVCEDHQGALWIGYNGERVDQWRDGKLLQFISLWPGRFDQWKTQGLVKLSVRTVFEDKNQQVWVGASIWTDPSVRWSPRFCLFRLQNGRFQPDQGPAAINQGVSALHQDRQGLLWLGTQGGLARWDGRDWKLFTTGDGLSSDDVRALADDADGNLWVGTEGGGLNCLREGKFTAFRRQDKDGLPSDDISSLYVDGDGVLWIGTSSGLARFARGQWTRYTTQEGLLSDKIGYLLEDGLGYLWLGSNIGLMRVAKQDLNAFAKAPRTPGAPTSVAGRTFGKADGLPTGECSTGSQPAACRTKDGRLWFPTIKGLASVDPKLLRRNTNPPLVLIESVRIDGQLQNPDTLRASPPQAVTVPAGKEALEIGYTCFNLSAPDKVRFQYRLEGYETAWTEWDYQTRAAHYPKLPPGHYRFHLKACNEDSVWNEAGTFLDVTVLPAFWQTGWFIAATIACLIGLIGGSVYYVSTQKLQRQLAVLRQQEALEKERARIARDLHDQLGANLTQVALLGEMAETDKDAPAEVATHARQIAQTARDTTRALDEIVWTVNPSYDTLDGLINYICKYAQEYLAVAGLRYRLDVPAQLPGATISPEIRHNVFLAAKEAITNVVRHAKAATASLRLRLQPTTFTLEIEDDGRGVADLAEKAGQSRNGLSNMRKRMEDIGGSFAISPATGGGTVVRLTVPLANGAATASDT